MSLHFQKSTRKGFFLPREVSNQIPFSSDKVEETLQILSLDPKSKEAYVLSKRIELCEEPTIEGVEKKCVTSLESMVDYVISKIGTCVKALTTQVEKDSTTEYTIKGLKKLVKDDRETVVCHKMGYPYAVFFCHRTKTIRSYMASLVGKDGTNIEAVAILMVPFVILGFVMKPLQLKGFAPAGSKKAASVETVAPDALDSQILVTDDSEEKNDNLGEASKSGNVFTRFLSDMKGLLSEKVYVVNVLGYISYNFVLGAYSYWGPKAGYNIYNMANADMVFGGITVGCGLAGTIGGGFVLDYINSTLSNAFKLLSASTFLGAVFCFSAFCFKKEIYFLIFFAIGELLVFATQAPVNYVCLHSVKPSLRPLSMAMSTVSIHVFGDVPSSPLVGVLQDHIHNWRKTALSLTSILFLAAAIWFIGIFLRCPDKFNEESEHSISELNNTNKAPLLDDEANTA